MRVCQKHWKPATMTLKSLKDGTEYDLCPVCIDELSEILNGKPEVEVDSGRKRTVGRPKAAKN